MTLLFLGTIARKGGRTICGILRELSLQGELSFTSFHQLLNRCRWSCLQSVKILFHLLLPLAGDRVQLVIYDTLKEEMEKRFELKGCIVMPSFHRRIGSSKAGG